MKLKDKVAIVTGAGRNIGEETAKLFASEGAKLVIVDMDQGRGHAVTEALNNENAGIAIAALRKLKLKKLTTKDYAALSKTQLIGRYQTITKGKLIKIIKPSNKLIIDGCHNVLGAQELTKTVRKKEKSRDIIFIVGMLNSKDSRGFFKEVKKIAKIVYTIKIPNQKNSISAEKLTLTAKQVGITSKACKSLKIALRRLAQSHPHSTIIICGSLYLAGEALKTN